MSVSREQPHNGGMLIGIEERRLLHVAPTRGFRRENDRRRRQLRKSISGSSDTSMPSVSCPGEEQQSLLRFCAVLLALVIVNLPSSTTVRCSGHALVGSIVGSPGAASCALRWKLTGPRFRRSGSSSIRKSGAIRRVGACRWTVRSGSI